MARLDVRRAVPLLFLGLMACDEATGPEAFEVYELVEVAGEPLPATIEWSPGFSQTYVSDVIRIFEDDRWDRVQTLRFGQGDREEDLISASEGTLIPDGDGAVLHYECNDTGTCVAPDRLRFVEGGAVIERPLTPDSVFVWRYRLAGGDE